VKKRKLKRRKKQKSKPTLRVEPLDGHRICFECYYKNQKAITAAREDIIGIFSGQGASIPPGLQLALCPRHFKKLYEKMGKILEE
jgi:hypothetical protein